MRVAVVLIALLAAGLAPAASASSGIHVEAEAAYWGEAGARLEASPGDTSRVLTVEIRNTGPATITGVTAELDLPRGFNASYEDADRATTGAIASGGVWSARFVLDVPPTAVPGESVTFRGVVSARPVENASTGEVGGRRTETFDVEVPITGRSRLTLAADRDDLPAHDIANVTLSLRNDGDGDIGTVAVEVTNAPGSALRVRSPIGPVEVPGVPARGSASVDVTLVTPATLGIETVLVKVSYADATGTRVTVDREVPFVVFDPGAPPFHVTLAEARVKAGRSQILHFAVHNGGSVLATEVTATLATGNVAIVPVNATNVQSLPDLGPGDNTTLEVPVVVSASARGAQALQFTLAWRGPEGARHTHDYDLGVEIEGAIEVLASETCALYDTEARSLVVRGVVTNVGNTDAHDADVTVGDASDELGDLAANEPVSFSVRIADATAPTGPVRALARWSDDLGRRESAGFDVPLVGDGAPSRCLDRPLNEDKDVPAGGSATLVLVLASAAMALLRWRSARPR